MCKVFILIVCVFVVVLVWVGNDDYVVMLGYLVNSCIDGNVLCGVMGVSVVNLFVGDLNQQVNLCVFVSGGQVQIQVLQLQSDNQVDCFCVVSVSIGGNVYVGGSGLVFINQVSGSGNVQFNVVLVELVF